MARTSIRAAPVPKAASVTGAYTPERRAPNWLRTAGLDTISASRTATGITLHRKSPDAFPASRPHKLTVGGYDLEGWSTTVDALLDADEVSVDLDPSVAVVIPDAGDDVLDTARAADLFALVDLAARRGENPVTERAHDLLRAVAVSGDLHAVPSD